MNEQLNQLAQFWEAVALKVRKESSQEADHESLVSREEASILEDCAKQLRQVAAGELDPSKLCDSEDLK